MSKWNNGNSVNNFRSMLYENVKSDKEMTKEELRKSLDFVNEERERLQQEIDRLNKEVEKLKKYVYHIQQVVGNNVIAMIGDINDE